MWSTKDPKIVETEERGSYHGEERRQPDAGRFLNCIFMLARISGPAGGSESEGKKGECIIEQTGTLIRTCGYPLMRPDSATEGAKLVIPIVVFFPR